MEPPKATNKVWIRPLHHSYFPTRVFPYTGVIPGKSCGKFCISLNTTVGDLGFTWQYTLIKYCSISYSCDCYIIYIATCVHQYLLSLSLLWWSVSQVQFIYPQGWSLNKLHRLQPSLVSSLEKERLACTDALLVNLNVAVTFMTFNLGGCVPWLSSSAGLKMLP